MTLRHPVVITSLEEDFRKIGLLQEAPTREPEEAMDFDAEDELDADSFDEIEDEADGEDVEEGRSFIGKKGLPKGKGGKTGTGSPGKNMGTNAIDYGTEDEDEDLDPALAEAIEFAEAHNSEWHAMGREGIETIHLDEEAMAEMEDLAEEVVELPGGIYEGSSDEDEEIEEDEDEDDEDVVSDALDSIEKLASTDSVSTAEEAVPAFANMALIAEQLYGFFTEAEELTEDADYGSMASVYADMAKFSAGTVDFLRETDADEVDFDALQETFVEYLDTLLKGVEAYAALTEAVNDDEDEDDGVDFDEDEDEEGNG